MGNSRQRRFPIRMRHVLRALVTLAGVVAGASLLGMLWPRSDRGIEPRRELSAADLGERPARAITVLLIGSDADRTGGPAAVPPGPANSDALLMVRVNPAGPLQVLLLPAELAVRLPGEEEPRALGSLYAKGDVALTADVVRELVGLPATEPDRFVVVPRRALRELIDGLGSIAVNPPRTMRYEDKSQGLKIDLQSGLQRLDGEKVEELVRFRDKWLGESGRRANQELVVRSLREELMRPERLATLPDLMRSVKGQTKTNLTNTEALRLLSSALDASRPIQFSTLPLTAAKPAHGDLRQLDKAATGNLWSAPADR